MSFWDAFDFWRDPMLAITITGAMCAVLGVYVVLRRVVFVGAALTQISGVGIALSFWLGAVLGAGDPHAAGHPIWADPLLYSLAASVLGALFFSLNRGTRRVPSETIVGLGWVLSAALLLLILSSERIAQETHEVDDLLYGSAVLAGAGEVQRLAAVAGAILAVHVLFFKELLFVTYDAEMARTLGYRTALWDALLYVTIGVGISFAVRTVGMLPAFGFLAIPSSAALLVARRISVVMPLAVIFAVLGGALGFYAAFTMELPTGPAVVAVSALFLIPGVVIRLIRRGT
jgi:zinc transport system permease protein